MKSIILLRTSTTDQHPELQLKDCEEYNKSNGWNCIKIFERQESAFKNEDGVWKKEIEWAIRNQIKHIIVWNMDRFSRLPEDRVLDEVKILSTVHDLQLHAVNGDAWSDAVETVAKLRQTGFIGKALAEFLETILRGLEFQRAHRESKVKSERVILAVRKKEGKTTRSYKGKKWGRPKIHTNKKKIILGLREEGKSLREISKITKISLGSVSGVCSEIPTQKDHIQTPYKMDVQ